MENVGIAWGDILKEFDEEYHYFHDNSPKFLCFKENQHEAEFNDNCTKFFVRTVASIK